MMGREITMEQLRQDVGLMIEKITHVTLMFRQIKLTMEEYVCLKVITMLNQGNQTHAFYWSKIGDVIGFDWLQRSRGAVPVVANWIPSTNGT